MGQRELDTDEIADIYDELLKTYKTEWEYRGHRSLHLAYYDDDHDEPGEAAMNTMRVLSEAAEINSTDRVLNIGCGAGEDSVWNAKAYGVPVTGVNISETQLELARENAREHGVESLTTFTYDDFHDLETVDDSSMTLVWGLEALSHSPDRETALQTARRVLTDDGRVAFTDLFISTAFDSLTPTQTEQVETINEALGVRLGPIGEFEATLQQTGFEHIQIQDLTSGVRPCTKRRKKFARVAHPVGRLLSRAGVGSKHQLDALEASARIHDLITADVLGYYLITADRGETKQ